MAISLLHRILNGTMRVILRSPLHGMVSKSVMLISFQGRKSGKTISTPVSYSMDGDRITVFTGSSWWKNLGSGAQVTMRIKGKDVHGFAIPCDNDQKAKAEGLARHLSVVRSDAKFYGVTFGKDGKPVREQIEKGAKNSVMIRIKMKK